MTYFGEDTPLLQRLWVGLRGAVTPRALPEDSSVRTLVIGHRGHQKRAPENTIASCKLAIEAGADGIEVDICVTRDGHAVLVHDRDPDERIARARQSGAEGCAFVPRTPDRGAAHRRPVSELTFAELHASYGYMRAKNVPLDWLGIDERAEHGIDRLDDLLAWAGSEPRLRAIFLDIKLTPAEAPLAAPFLDTIQKACAHHEGLREKWFPALCPHRETYESLSKQLEERASSALSCICPTPDFELPGIVRIAREVSARNVSIGITPRRFWTSVREDVFEAVESRSRGEFDKVIVWTANEADQIATLLAARVDAIVTDEIELTKDIVEGL